MFNLYIIGAPLMFTIFFIEFVLTILHDGERSLLNDMLSNLFIAFSSLVAGLLVKSLAFTVFSLIYSFTFFKISNSAILWVWAFLCCDLGHYFFHWLGHKTRLLWAGHVTHHTSLFYNFSVGFRVNGIHSAYRFLFFTPLCLFGCPPEIIIFFESVTTIWNFLLHTEKIKKLGVLDLVLNTPSNHRVHHGSNTEYLDKNLGGITVIYDHLFGTYKRETTTPVYGITQNVYSDDPVKLTLHEYIDVLKATAKQQGLKAKLKSLFTPPGSGKKHKEKNKLQIIKPIYPSVKKAI